MGKPGVANLDVYRGDTFTLLLEFYSDLAKTVPVNVSARTFTSQIREYIGATDAISMSVDMSNAATGVVVFTVAATVTATIAFDVGGWDVQQVVGGVTTTLAAGSVTIDGEYTHA